MKRKEKRDRNLREVLCSTSTPPLNQSFPLVVKSGPPPPPTSPNTQQRLSPLLPSIYAIPQPAKRPCTAELHKAISSARVLLRNKKSPKMVKKLFKPIKKSIQRSTEGHHIDSVGDLSVSGTHRSVENVNKVEMHKDSVRDGGDEIRKSKGKMKAVAEEEKKKAKDEIDLTKTLPEITKDTQTFIRNHATMNLTALRQLEKQYRYNKKNKDMESKTGLVAQVRQEREVRRERLQQYQAMIKENIMSWRIEEETRLQREREKQDIRKEEDHLRRVANVEKEYEAIQCRINDEEFAKKFVQTNVAIDNKITMEKRRLERRGNHVHYY